MGTVDFTRARVYFPRLEIHEARQHSGAGLRTRRCKQMKVRSSLRSLKNRHRDCQVVRRRGRVYVINKRDPRFKARAG